MRKAAFLVSKQPFGSIRDGETMVTRLLLDAAAESVSVGVVALANEPGPDGGFELTEVPKPPLRVAPLAARALRRRRSLIHERFAPPDLVRVVGGVAADVLVARRAYMAQAAIDSGRVPPATPLAVIVDVLESSALLARRGPARPAFAWEARRTRRDELRAVEAASAVAWLSETEREQAGGAVSGGGIRLDLVLPPAEEPAALDSQLAVFVGDRTWLPNAQALERLLGLWPRIREAVPTARLVVAGRPSRRGRNADVEGVEFIGFVEDLNSVWRSAGVLLAPVATGGGVRVKVLDAVRHGVPVVGTPAAMGSVGDYLPTGRAATGDDQFVAQAARLLSDGSARRSLGAELYSANRDLDNGGFVAEQVSRLLSSAA